MGFAGLWRECGDCVFGVGERGITPSSPLRHCAKKMTYRHRRYRTLVNLWKFIHLVTFEMDLIDERDSDFFEEIG